MADIFREFYRDLDARVPESHQPSQLYAVAPGRQQLNELLCTLIGKYDAEHVKWPKVKGRGILQHLLGEHELAEADLSRILGGSRNLGTMILRGDRNLTLAHVRKLAALFKVSPELFI